MRRRVRGTRRVLSVSDVLLLAAVAGLPWVWGGVGLGASRTAAALIAAAAGWALARGGVSRAGPGRRAWTLPAFALAAWAFVQAAPLPPAVVRAVSPRAAVIQSETLGPGAPDAEGWLRQIEASARARVPEAAGSDARGQGLVPAADAPVPPRWFRLSLDPATTLERAFWFVALLAAFLLTLTRAADSRRLAIYRWTVFGVSGALAVIGLANHVTAPRTLLWLRDAPDGARSFGPYVNPAHFAAAMELSVPWMLGHSLSPFERGGSWSRLGGGRWLSLALALLGLAAATMAASKTAMLTLGASSLLIVVVGARRGRAWRSLGAAALAAGVTFAALAAAGPLRGRVSDFFSIHGTSAHDTDRRVVWRVGVDAWKDFPVAGSGLGAFRVVIPAYLPGGERDQWLQMHNDYLEVLVGGGAVAAALVIWLCAGFVRRTIPAVRLAASEGRVLPALGLGCGLASLAVHEFVEFSLQTPANALLFVTVAACAIAPLGRVREEP